MPEFSSDSFFANVVEYLKEDNEDDAVFVLQLCEGTASDDVEMIDSHWGVGPHHTVFISLGCPRRAYDILKDKSHPIRNAIVCALQASLPDSDSDYELDIQLERVNLADEVLERLLRIRDQPHLSHQTSNHPPTSANDTPTGTMALSRTDVFIVYGHDAAARFELAHHLEAELHIHGIMLDQHQPKSSNTVIEELEQQAQTAGYAIVLLTPDDIGALQGTSEMEPRARQNVIYEAGYFHGLLGRERVLIMKKGEMDIPSDLKGILHVEMDRSGGWKANLREKLRHLGMLKGEPT